MARLEKAAYILVNAKAHYPTMNLSPRLAYWLFAILVVFQLTQTIWWFVFMNQLLDEQAAVALQLQGSAEVMQAIQQRGTERQIMIGLEGSFFLLVFAIGIWLMYRSLVRSDELKFHQQNFLMAVTHEFKTPIASMRIYLDTLRSHKIAPEKKQEIIPRLSEDVNRLEKLVDNVLHAARFEKHGYRLQREQFDLSRLVKERVLHVEKIPAAVPKVIRADIQDGIEIDGDSAALSRAIDAILENSLCYYSKSPIEINVMLRATHGLVTIAISDNGIGIDKKDIRRLFDRFYRVGNEMTRRSSGTGLGLYLCREIIHAHGGTVTAESEGANKGATFTMTLKMA